MEISQELIREVSTCLKLSMYPTYHQCLSADQLLNGPLGSEESIKIDLVKHHISHVMLYYANDSPWNFMERRREALRALLLNMKDAFGSHTRNELFLVHNRDHLSALPDLR